MNLEFLKRRWYYFAPVILVLVPLLLTVFISMKYGYSMSESWTAVRHIGQTGTRFAQKFEERNFNKIRPGMDGRQVYQTMGMQPMEGHANGGLEWKYSLPSGGAAFFHERVVIMEPHPTKGPVVKQVIKRIHTPPPSPVLK